MPHLNPNRCRKGQMNPLLTWRNSFQNQGHQNHPSPTLTTPLKGTPRPLEPALLTCPLVASPLQCAHIPKALPPHHALFPAPLLQPLNLLPLVQPRPRCPRGLTPRISEGRASPCKITQNLWSRVSVSTIITMEIFCCQKELQLNSLVHAVFKAIQALSFISLNLSTCEACFFNTLQLW